MVKYNILLVFGCFSFSILKVKIYLHENTIEIFEFTLLQVNLYTDPETLKMMGKLATDFVMCYFSLGSEHILVAQ